MLFASTGRHSQLESILQVSLRLSTVSDRILEPSLGVLVLSLPVKMDQTRGPTILSETITVPEKEGSWRRCAADSGSKESLEMRMRFVEGNPMMREAEMRRSHLLYKSRVFS